MVAIITYYGLSAIIAAILAAFIAPKRGRSADSWAFASFVFPGALLLLLFLAKGPGVRRLTEDEKLLKALRENGS